MCSVAGCDASRRGDGVQRFKLPEDPERRLEWVQFVLDVNGQRLQESSWTDIIICKEHFKEECFENVNGVGGSVQLKPDALPSLSPKATTKGPELHQEAAETASNIDEPKTCEGDSSTSSCESSDNVIVPECAELKDVFDYGEMLHKIVNIEVIKEKVTLLRMKGKYVVNENRLLQLFSRKCPSCSSKVKLEKEVHGTLIIMNQQCLQCNYRNQWSSQLSACIPAAEESASTDQNLSSNSDVGEIVAVMDEESDVVDETQESSDPGDVDSSEDDYWTPPWKYQSSDMQKANKKEAHVVPKDRHSHLCTDCGRFFQERHNHQCEHKVKPFSCNICGKRCATEHSLKSHSRIHDVNYMHHCKYCHVLFKTKVDKVSHEQIHITQGKPYKCPDCPKRFATSKQRVTHLEMHRGPIQLKCHICGIQFDRGCALQRHLIVHTGKKPFKCPQCERGFNQASHLKSHMRLHTGERPYKCEHCNEGFNHNVSLKSHVLRYHTADSGPKRKKKEVHKRRSSAQVSGNRTEADSGIGHVEVEQEVQKETMCVSRKKRSSLRPPGRPKRDKEKGSNAKRRKRGRKTRRKSDEKREAEPTESEQSLHSTEEEKEEEEGTRSEKVTPNMGRFRVKT